MDRVKTMLFRPFALDKWLIIGFAAWLSRLGRSPGPGASFRVGRPPGFEFETAFAEAREYILNNLGWIIPLVIGIGLVALVVWLLFTWLSSRGHFLFLHSVATNKAEILDPWTRLGRFGDSLFLFRVALGLIKFGLMLPFIIWAFLILGRLMGGEVPNLFVVLRLLPTIAGIATVAMLSALVHKLTLDFAVPIMALKGLGPLAAWRMLVSLTVAAPLSFVLYILFSIVLSIAIAFLVVAIALATCCCGGCLLALPYIGTVFFLPVLIFRRAYSLYYLAQFGPEMNVFAAL